MNPMSDSDLVCRHCGAPAKPNEVLCEFCSAAVSEQAMQNAVACPACKHPVVNGTMECTKCRYVEQCLFCARVSPIGAAQCVGCNEAFAGMKERKAAHDAQLQRQQLIKVGEEVASVALPLVGGASGSGLLGALERIVEDVSIPGSGRCAPEKS